MKTEAIDQKYIDCPTCNGNGSTPAYVVVREGIRMILTGLPSKEDEDHLAIAKFLAGRDPDPTIGYTCVDDHRATKKLMKLAGIRENWGTCQTCHGDGEVLEEMVKFWIRSKIIRPVY